MTHVENRICIGLRSCQVLGASLKNSASPTNRTRRSLRSDEVDSHESIGGRELVDTHVRSVRDQPCRGERRWRRSVADLNCELWTVVDCQHCLLFEFFWNLPVDTQDGVALIVGVEQLRGEHVAAIVALTRINVQVDFHASTIDQPSAISLVKVNSGWSVSRRWSQ